MFFCQSDLGLGSSSQFRDDLLVALWASQERVCLEHDEERRNEGCSRHWPDGWMDCGAWLERKEGVCDCAFSRGDVVGATQSKIPANSGVFEGSWEDQKQERLRDSPPSRSDGKTASKEKKESLNLKRVFTVSSQNKNEKKKAWEKIYWFIFSCIKRVCTAVHALLKKGVVQGTGHRRHRRWSCRGGTCPRSCDSNG